MDRARLWLPLLFSFSVVLSNAALDTYIVSVSMPDELQQADFVALESYYKSFLPSSSTPDAGNLADSRLVYSYQEVFSGFSAWLTPEEVREMEQKPGFLRAFPDYNIPLLTTHTPEFLRLRLGQGLWKDGNNLGEGIIIGMVDSGVASEHPSYNDQGMPPPPAKWKGTCDPTKLDRCNNKLIGGKTFGGTNVGGRPDFPDDEIGHGTHTSSTAAGAFVRGAAMYGSDARGTASGIAPRAHLAMYKVCGGNSCAASDVLKGIDTAVSDGVDVISLSLGLSTGPFYSDPIAIGTFGAVSKGVFVSCAGGNSGPGASSLLNDAPWVITVAAGTIDRTIRVTTKLPDGREFYGQGLNQTKDFPKTEFPLIHPDTCSSEDCGVAGKAVLCDDFQRCSSDVLLSQGAVAIIIRNKVERGDTIVADGGLSLPAAFVNYGDGQQLLQYSQASSKPVVSFSFDGTILGTSPAPEVASFSSRGPSTKIPLIIKPDIAAPGVNILAAWPWDPTFSTAVPAGSHDEPLYFNMLSGTSMAAPHISGTAALVKRAHPDWSPAAIRSAIMTTSYVLDNTGKPIMNGLHQSASFYEMGAGHVDASAAADPGLVYDTIVDDYMSLLCGLGYTAKQISSINRGRAVNCAGLKPTSQQGFNYPSIAVPFSSSTDLISVNRTVTNVGPAPATYEAQVDEMPGLVVTVTPSKLVFRKEKETRTFTVTFAGNGVNIPTRMNSTEGNLRWVSGKRIVRSPLLVKFIREL